MKLLFWPFILIWKLITCLFCLMGRLISAIVGILIIIVGIILTVTVIGALAGIPLIIFGVLLIIRALF